MKFFERLSSGWKLGKTSLSTINENRSLLLFPLISGLAIVLISITYFGGTFLAFGENIQALGEEGAAAGAADLTLLLLLFIFYIINYFVVIFFNVGLVHCSREILEGRETQVMDGINHALTRVGTIFSWALLAATVGIILKAIQERAGTVGNIIAGIIGIVWGIATFFVVPIIAYEDVSPFQAVKRSSSIMKEKWGESLGASFSFGLFTLIGIFLVALPIGVLTFFIHPALGIAAVVTIIVLVQIVVSSANMVFITAAYQNVNDQPIGQFERKELDAIFYRR